MHFGFNNMFLFRYLGFFIFGFNEPEGVMILIQYVFNDLFCLLKLTRDWRELKFSISDSFHSQLFFQQKLSLLRPAVRLPNSILVH